MGYIDNEEEMGEFFERNYANFYKAGLVSEYSNLIAYNNYIICNIKQLLTLLFLTILANPKYYNILNMYNKFTILLENAKVEIYDFYVIIGTDEETKSHPSSSTHMFSATIYYEDKVLIDVWVDLRYNDKSGISIAFFYSKTLDDDLKVKEINVLNLLKDDDYLSLRDKAIKKNELLCHINSKLDNIIMKEDLSKIRNRSVFILR